MRLVMVFHIVYFTLVDYHPVRIANAKLRALTVFKKAFCILCVCIYLCMYVCVCLYDTCGSTYTSLQDLGGISLLQ